MDGRFGDEIDIHPIDARLIHGIDQAFAGFGKAVDPDPPAGMGHPVMRGGPLRQRHLVIGSVFKGVEPQRRGADAVETGVGGKRQQGGRIKTPREKQADRHIGDHVMADGVLQQAAKFGPAVCAPLFSLPGQHGAYGPETVRRPRPLRVDPQR